MLQALPTSKVFRYSRKSFFLDLLMVLAAGAVLLVLLGVSTGYDILTVSIGLAVELLVIFLLGVTPLLTYHEIRGDKLILRQGWYFKAEIPLTRIKSVEMMEKGPIRTGVFFRILQSTLFVTSKRHDLIVLKLKEKQRFGWALGKRADTVIFDAMGSERFLRAVEESSAVTRANPGRAS